MFYFGCETLKKGVKYEPGKRNYIYYGRIRAGYAVDPGRIYLKGGVMETLWEFTKGYDLIVLGGLMLAGVLTAFVWGFTIGISQAEIDDEDA